jgi:hypothetical protein
VIFAAAMFLSCLVRDSGPAIDAWLRGLGMTPAAIAYSERFERQAVLWRGGDRYAIVMPDRGRACVIDMGRDWRRTAA